MSLPRTPIIKRNVHIQQRVHQIHVTILPADIRQAGYELVPIRQLTLLPHPPRLLPTIHSTLRSLRGPMSRAHGRFHRLGNFALTLTSLLGPFRALRLRLFQLAIVLRSACKSMIGIDQRRPIRFTSFKVRKKGSALLLEVFDLVNDVSL